MELARDGQRALVVARRLFSGRDGRLALTVVLAVTAAIEASIYTPDTYDDFPFERQGDPALAVFLNVLAVVPLFVALRFPLVAAVGSTLFTMLLLAAPEAPVTLTALGVLLYTLGHLVVRRGLVYGAAFILPFLVNAMSPLDGGSAGPSSVAPLLLVAAAMVIGESTRKRTEIGAALDATQEAMAESEREQTVMEERARIARELHDIVAHHLSVIAVQSETARLTSPRLSADARGRFEAIAATARDALTETRRLLGVLREDVGGEADRAPRPGLDQLAELVDTARDSGGKIRLIMQGKAVPLPAGVDLAAYRIVQEALTNARRHAPGADVDVELSYGDSSLLLRVRDYGPGAADGELTSGHGLVGMRDRATIAGGTFTCGAADGGGFMVEVTLPIAGAVS
ncbi:MAG TPA: sensor histidine kinase [Gaiella sp.]|jgi:signal transduction histidine kinase|nr:sensor histidine kinase [Gaiella sp.]